MNTRSIMFNLEEALEQLNSTVNDLKNTKGYNEDDFRVQIEHLYHHINFAWNTRHEPDEQVIAAVLLDRIRAVRPT